MSTPPTITDQIKAAYEWAKGNVFISLLLVVVLAWVIYLLLPVVFKVLFLLALLWFVALIIGSFRLP